VPHRNGRSALRGTTYNGKKNNADEDLRHAERFACAFRSANEDFTHPRRQHRCADKAQNGARHTPLFTFVVRPARTRLNTRKCAGMRLKREHEVKSVRQQQHGSNPNVKKLFLPYGALWREVATKRARHGEAHGGQ